MQDAQKAAKKVVNGDALSGKVKTAINADISNHQLPMLTNYYDALHYLSQTLTERLTAFKSGVNEHSSSAVIDTEKLDALERKLSDKETDYFKLEGQFNQAYSQVAGIMSFDKPNAKKLTTDFNAAKKVLTNTKKDMASFVINVRASAVTAILDKQASELTRVSNAVSLSYTSPQALSIYGSQDFKNATKAQHLSVKTAEKAALKAQQRELTKNQLALAMIQPNILTGLLQKTSKFINKNKKTIQKLNESAIQDLMMALAKETTEKVSRQLYKLSDSTDTYLVKYLDQIGEAALTMEHISKKIPILGAGIIFKDDYRESGDFGQALVHTGLNTVIGSVIDFTTVFLGGVTEITSFGTATLPAIGITVSGLGVSVVAQNEIDDFFEEVPMKTWTDRITKAFEEREKLNEKYINNNPELTDYEKDYFRKYSGDPMDAYRGLVNEFK